MAQDDAGSRQVPMDAGASSNQQDVPETVLSLSTSPSELQAGADLAAAALADDINDVRDGASSPNPEKMAANLVKMVQEVLASEATNLQAGASCKLSPCTASTCFSICELIAGASEKIQLSFSEPQLLALTSFLGLLLSASEVPSQTGQTTESTALSPEHADKPEEVQAWKPSLHMYALQALGQLVRDNAAKLGSDEITAIFERCLAWAADVPWPTTGTENGAILGGHSEGPSSVEKETNIDSEQELGSVEKKMEGRRLVFSIVSDLYEQAAPGLTRDHGAMALAAVRKVLHPFTSAAGPPLEDAPSSRLYEAVLKCAQLLLEDSKLQEDTEEEAGEEREADEGGMEIDRLEEKVVNAMEVSSPVEQEGEEGQEAQPGAEDEVGKESRAQQGRGEEWEEAVEEAHGVEESADVGTLKRKRGSQGGEGMSPEDGDVVASDAQPMADVKTEESPATPPLNFPGVQEGPVSSTPASGLPEAEVVGSECVYELELSNLDSVDTRPWLLSRHCTRFFAQEFGVTVVCSAASLTSEPLPKDSVHVKISKRLEGDWRAAEAKWFVSAAADSLQTIGTRGMCSRRLYYEGPLSRTPGDVAPSIKEVAKRISGEDRANLEKIEEATGTVLKMAQVKGTVEEEKGKNGAALGGGTGGGGEEEGGGQAGGAVWRIIVRIRAVRMPALATAEEAVTRLLHKTAAHFVREVEAKQMEARVSEAKRVVAMSLNSAISQGAIPQGEDKPAASRTPVKTSLPAEEAKAGGEIAPADAGRAEGKPNLETPASKRMRTSPDLGANSLAAPKPVPSDQVDEGKTLTTAQTQKEGLVEKEDAELREAAISDIPSTKTLLVSSGSGFKGDLSAAFLRSLFDSVLGERLEIPEGLLDGDQMVLKITPLDTALAMVELAHEQLAGACVELHQIEPDVFKGLSLELGPGGDHTPSGRDIPRLVIDPLPAGTGMDEVYSTFHKALHAHATNSEKYRGRKEGKGKLVLAVKVDEKARLGYVYLPTRQLADRAITVYEADRRAFGNLRLKREKTREGTNSASLKPPSGPLPPAHEARRPARREESRREIVEAVTRPRVSEAAIGQSQGARLDPNSTLYVQKLPPAASSSAIGVMVTSILERHLGSRELQTAEPGKVVEEVRKVKPFYALVKLGSQHLVKRALELYRDNPAVFEGIEVKPHKGSRFDFEFAGAADSRPHVASKGLEYEEQRYGHRQDGDGRHRSDVYLDQDYRDHRTHRDPHDKHSTSIGRREVSHRPPLALSQVDRSYGGASNGGAEWWRSDAGPSVRGGHHGEEPYEALRHGHAWAEADQDSGGPEGFVKLDRRRCVHVSVSRPLDEVFMRNLIEKILKEETGQSGQLTSRYKVLKGGRSCFLELARGELVNVLLRAYERDPEPKLRFARMMLRSGLPHA